MGFKKGEINLFSLRNIQKKFALALALTLLTSPSMVRAKEDFTRISGKDRYETSQAISEYGWESSSYVLIAQGEGFADALCSVPMAKKYNAPILLTSKNKLNEKIEKEIKRLNPSNIILIGGEGALNKELETYIKNNFESATVKRIAGVDRYETSVKIAEELGFEGEVALASAKDFADALSIASIAAYRGMPILLTEKDKLPNKISEYLKDKNIEKSYIIGGTGVISSKIGNELHNPIRLAGSNRYETNVEIMKAFEEEIDFEKIFTAIGQGSKGNEFADALSGAALAGRLNAPIVLSNTDIPKVTEDYLKGTLNLDSQVFALGGERVLPNETVKKAVPTYESKGKAGEELKDVAWNGTIKLEGDNVKIQGGEIKGSLHIFGNNVEINNLKVSGNIFVNSGKGKEVKLNGIEATNIKVNSGKLYLSGEVKSTVTLKGEVELVGGSSAISTVKVYGKDTLAKITGKIGELKVESGKKIEILEGSSIEKLVAGNSKGKDIEVNIAKDVKIEEAKGELKLTGEGASNVVVAPPAGGGVAIPPGEGVKITRISLTSTDGSISNSINGSNINIDLSGFNGKITGMNLFCSSAINNVKVDNMLISNDEIVNIFGKGATSFDLIEYLRAKDLDREKDGIGKSNLMLFNGANITIVGENGVDTRYTLSIIE